MRSVVVLGGGFSGLHAALWLSEVPQTRILLLEARPKCGGRAQTTFDSGQRVRYERGPWRLLRSQKLARALARSFGCHLRPLSHDLPGALRRFPAVEVRTSAEGPLEGLSDWDEDVRATSIPVADRKDRATGYAGLRRLEAAGSNTYNVSAVDAHPPGSVVLEGFETLVERIVAALSQRPNFSLCTNSKILAVSRDAETQKYRVSYRQRLASGAFQEDTQVEADVVICALPPSTWEEAMEATTVMPHLRLLTYLVTAHPLARAYAEVAPELWELLGVSRYHMISPESAVAQLISPNYHNDWAAVAYVGSEEAWLLRRLQLSADASALSSFVCRELCVLLSTCGFSVDSEEWKQRLLAGLRRSLDVCFHAEAVHSWLPNSECPKGLKARRRMARRCVLSPHRTRLPGFFVLGEAFSTKQGWIEGALETSQWLKHHWPAFCSDASLPRQLAPQSGRWLVYDGRLIEVSSWLDRHPGGRMALLHHENEDVTQLMAHISHPPYALATLWYLQKGWGL